MRREDQAGQADIGDVLAIGMDAGVEVQRRAGQMKTVIRPGV
jgi:hypothetical protein